APSGQERACISMSTELTASVRGHTLPGRAAPISRQEPPPGTHRHMPDPQLFAPIEEAIEVFRRGGMVIIIDDEDRENEGDLAIAAEKVTPQAINFMTKTGRGLICLTLTEERCQELKLPLMVADNTSPFGTAFTVSIEARGKTTTGISA